MGFACSTPDARSASMRSADMPSIFDKLIKIVIMTMNAIDGAKNTASPDVIGQGSMWIRITRNDKR